MSWTRVGADVDREGRDRHSAGAPAPPKRVNTEFQGTRRVIGLEAQMKGVDQFGKFC